MKILAIFMAILIFYTAFDTVATIAQEFEEHEQDALSRNTEPAIEYKSMIATAYCINGTTATQTRTRPGIAASKKEWYGKKARIYWNDGGEPGAMIGEYVIEDTGGRSIRSGKVIDIWLPTEEECKQFGRRAVLVEITE